MAPRAVVWACLVVMLVVLLLGEGFGGGRGQYREAPRSAEEEAIETIGAVEPILSSHFVKFHNGPEPPGGAGGVRLVSLPGREEISASAVLQLAEYLQQQLQSDEEWHATKELLYEMAAIAPDKAMMGPSESLAAAHSALLAATLQSSPPPSGSGRGSAGQGVPMSIALRPPSLDFGSAYLCEPAIAHIEVRNTHPSQELDLLRVKLSSRDFHVALTPTILPPKMAVNVSVVLLARANEQLEAEFVLETNRGDVVYSLRGSGVPSPYGIKPIMEYVLAKGDVLHRPIVLYNPGPDPLVVTEAYTSGGFLQLSVPVEQGSEEAWEIEPEDSESILFLSFSSNVPGLYKGAINIELDGGGQLVIPVNMHVVDGGLHLNPPSVEFSVTDVSVPDAKEQLAVLGRPLDSAVEMAVNVVNAGEQPVLVDSYGLTDNSDAVVVSFDPVVIPPSSEVTVAHVRAKSSPARTTRSVRGSIAFRTNATNEIVEMPYRVTTVRGGLEYSLGEVSFDYREVGEGDFARSIRVQNRFKQPFQVVHVGVEGNDALCFHVEAPSLPHTIPPGGSWDGILVRLLSTARAPCVAYVRLMSGLSHPLLVPLVIYDGTISWSGDSLSADLSETNLGMVPLGERTTYMYTLDNMNPTYVDVLSVVFVSVDVVAFQLELSKDCSELGQSVSVDCVGDGPTCSLTLAPRFAVPPLCRAHLSYTLLVTGEVDGEGAVEVRLSSAVFASRILYRSLTGSLALSPANLVFTPSFPGRSLSKVLSATNSFEQAVHVTMITSTDPRIVPYITDPVIPAHTTVEIANVVFDAAQYQGVAATAAANYLDDGAAVLSGPGEALTRADVRAFKRREHLWDTLVRDGNDQIRSLLTVQTNWLTAVLPVRASLTKPVIVREDSITFALTQLGNSEERIIRVVNPSDDPVHVQLLRQVAVSGQGKRSNQPFHIPANAELERVMAPRSKALLGPVIFSPTVSEKVNGTVYIKNNLTILHHLAVHGEGGTGKFLFASESGEPLDSLMVVVDADDMGRCYSQDQAALYLDPIRTSHSFVMKNGGNMPLEVFGFRLNGVPCTGFGFSIVHCRPQTLDPGQEAPFIVVFQPDFSSSVVARTLLVSTSHGQVEIPLVAHLPHEHVAACASAYSLLPEHRELHGRFAFVFGVVFVIFVVVLLRDYTIEVEAADLYVPELFVKARSFPSGASSVHDGSGDGGSVGRASPDPSPLPSPGGPYNDTEAGSEAESENDSDSSSEVALEFTPDPDGAAGVEETAASVEPVVADGFASTAGDQSSEPEKRDDSSEGSHDTNTPSDAPDERSVVATDNKKPPQESKKKDTSKGASSKGSSKSAKVTEPKVGPTFMVLPEPSVATVTKKRKKRSTSTKSKSTSVTKDTSSSRDGDKRGLEVKEIEKKETETREAEKKASFFNKKVAENKEAESRATVQRSAQAVQKTSDKRDNDGTGDDRQVTRPVHRKDEGTGGGEGRPVATSAPAVRGAQNGASQPKTVAHSRETPAHSRGAHARSSAPLKSVDGEVSGTGHAGASTRGTHGAMNLRRFAGADARRGNGRGMKRGGPRVPCVHDDGSVMSGRKEVKGRGGKAVKSQGADLQHVQGGSSGFADQQHHRHDGAKFFEMGRGRGGKRRGARGGKRRLVKGEVAAGKSFQSSFHERRGHSTRGGGSPSREQQRMEASAKHRDATPPRLTPTRPSPARGLGESDRDDGGIWSADGWASDLLEATRTAAAPVVPAAPLQSGLFSQSELAGSSTAFSIAMPYTSPPTTRPSGDGFPEHDAFGGDGWASPSAQGAAPAPMGSSSLFSNDLVFPAPIPAPTSASAVHSSASAVHSGAGANAGRGSAASSAMRGGRNDRHDTPGYSLWHNF